MHEADKLQRHFLRAYPVIKRETGFGSGGYDARRRDKAMRDIGADNEAE